MKTNIKRNDCRFLNSGNSISKKERGCKLFHFNLVTTVCFSTKHLTSIFYKQPGLNIHSEHNSELNIGRLERCFEQYILPGQTVNYKQVSLQHFVYLKCTFVKKKVHFTINAFKHYQNR